MDADKNIGGLADINLKADFYQSRVSFTATAKVEAGGLGGLIGGIGDIAGGAGDGNITFSDDVFYWEGLEQLQGVVGVLYDTTKNADYTANPKTWNSSNTKVWVNTHTDLIPFWPEGIAQEITITVQLNQTENVKSLTINKVWIDLYTDWNDAERKYDKKAQQAWSISPGDVLTKQGDERTYKHPIAIESEWGDKIGIIAMIDMTLVDNDDQTQYTVVYPFKENTHPQKIVNIRPISQGSFLSIILMFASLPFTLFSVIFAILGLLYTLLERKRRVHFLITAGLLEIFAVLFFINGANTLLGLIEFLTEEDYYWNVAGILVPALAGILLLVAFFIQWKFGPKDEDEEECAPEHEVKFDISAALAEGQAEEEGEEEEEGFECPACGTGFEEMVSECPSCGAEFEGLDDEDEEEDESSEVEVDEEREDEEEGEDDPEDED